jgi:hypothetical protein
MSRNKWLLRALGEAQEMSAIPAEAEPVEGAAKPPAEEPVDVESVPSAQVVDTLVAAWQRGDRNEAAAQLLFTPVSYADFVRMCFKLGESAGVELGYMLDELAESEGMVTDMPDENKLLSRIDANEPESPGEVISSDPNTP